MNWLTDNLPAISGSVVAVVSVFISAIKLLTENDTSSKKIKRLSDMASIYDQLPNELDARKTIGRILDIETGNVEKRLTRKVNLANVLAVIFISILGGGLSYLLALWATNTSTFWIIVAWLLFVVVAFLTIGIAIAGLASMYEPDKKKEQK